jgi:hypothetical protein
MLTRLSEFAEKYGLTFTIGDDVGVAIKSAIRAAHLAGMPVVFTLDEYDYLSRGKHLPKSTDGPPELDFMRSIFKALKTDDADRRPDLCFMTGVMPLLLTELSSATNDIRVLTHDPDFAGAIGLPQAAVTRELERIAAWAYRDGKGSSEDQAVFVGEMGAFMKVGRATGASSRVHAVATGMLLGMFVCDRSISTASVLWLVIRARRSDHPPCTTRSRR